MKILLVAPLPPPSGGMARWTQLYLAACQKEGITASVVNTSITQKRATRTGRAFSMIDEMKRTWHILKDLRKQKKNFAPDIIHICSSCSKWGLIRDYICAQIVGNMPLVFHCHCNIEDQATTRFSQWLLKRIEATSNGFWVLNGFSKKWAERGIFANIKLLPNFIAMEGERSPKTHGVLKRIIYVGHVRHSKGIQEIYQVAGACPDIEFQVVGPVQQLPSEHKPNNIVLFGEVPQTEVSGLLDKADVFLFPSHTEGFANVMLEAMAAGLPIIATDVGANRDMIENRGGIILPVGNCAAILSAIEKLKNETVRKQMSAWNILKVKMNYTTNIVMQQIKTYYEEILP